MLGLLSSSPSVMVLYQTKSSTKTMRRCELGGDLVEVPMKSSRLRSEEKQRERERDMASRAAVQHADEAAAMAALFFSITNGPR